MMSAIQRKPVQPQPQRGGKDGFKVTSGSCEMATGGRMHFVELVQG